MTRTLCAPRACLRSLGSANKSRLSSLQARLAEPLRIVHYRGKTLGYITHDKHSECRGPNDALIKLTDWYLPDLFCKDARARRQLVCQIYFSHILHFMFLQCFISRYLFCSVDIIHHLLPVTLWVFSKCRRVNYTYRKCSNKRPASNKRPPPSPRKYELRY